MLKHVVSALAVFAVPFLIGPAGAATAPDRVIKTTAPLVQYSRMPTAKKLPPTKLAQAESCGTNQRPTFACSCDSFDSAGACLQQYCETICVSTSEAGASGSLGE